MKNSSRKEMLEKLRNTRTIKFRVFIKYLADFGFNLSRKRGSHIIYKRAGIAEMLIITNYNGHVKQYHIKNFIKIVEDNNLVGSALSGYGKKDNSENS